MRRELDPGAALRVDPAALSDAERQAAEALRLAETPGRR